MELRKYPVLSKELSISKVITPEEDNILIYDTAKGVKGYPNAATFEFAQKCKGTKMLEEIITELSQISGEPPQEVQKDLSGLIEKMKENGMITFLPSPMNPPRSDPVEVQLHSRIENVSLEITHKCNLQCKHCYSNSGTKREHELTYEEFRKLIDQLAHIGVLNVMVTGGEPLLHPHFFEIIEYIRSRPMSCMLFTNGTLLTEHIVKKLKNLNVLCVAISLDGATAETHDSFRSVPGSFEKTVEAIKMLKGAGIPVRGNICIHKGNLNEIAAIITLLKQLGVDAYRMWPVSYSGRYGDSDIFVTREEIADVFKKVKQYKVERGEKLEMEFFYSQQVKNCGIGSGNLTIRSNGIVVPCTPFPDDASLGNVRETTVAEIWNNSPFLNEARTINAFEHEMCGTCKHVAVCRGGCIGDVYRRNGKLSCGNEFECAYFQVYDEYIVVDADERETLSVEIR